MADDDPRGRDDQPLGPEKGGFVPVAAARGSSDEATDPKAAKVKPDYLAFYEGNKISLSNLLATPVPEDDILYAFTPHWAHYFVLGNFRHFNGNIDWIFRALREALRPPSYPSLACLGALYHAQPLSLFEILRLHLAFEHIRTSPHHTEIARLIHRDLSRPLIEAGSVLPSMCYVDPVKLKARRAAAGLKEKEILRQAAQFLGVLLPPYLLSEWLERGQARGQGRRRPYRVTQALALALTVAFVGSQDHQLLKAEAAGLFPPNPHLGDGNGQWTVSLGIAHGNQLRLL